jgi:Skp family chaperone for outer membrane proteins
MGKEKWKRLLERADRAENEAANQRRRANEFQEVLQRLQRQLEESCVDIGEVLGAWDDD